MTPAPIQRRIELRGPLDLARTLAPLAHGRGDRTIQLAAGEARLAFRTPRGAASLRLLHGAAGVVEASAWGPGAEEAIRSAARLIGEEDRPEDFAAHHPILRALQRRHAGLRLPATGRVFHALVPSVLEQKITGTEAFRVYAALLRRHGEPAPGPVGLVLPPAPDRLARMPYHAWHPLGLERRRAEVIRLAASRAAWLDASRSSAEAQARLRSLPGIGPWTAAEVVRSSHGDPDAVSVGDYHIPNSVAWAIAGEPRGDDARMLQLLEPYRGQRGRVQRYLEVGRVTAPRRGRAWHRAESRPSERSAPRGAGTRPRSFRRYSRRSDTGPAVDRMKGRARPRARRTSASTPAGRTVIPTKVEAVHLARERWHITCRPRSRYFEGLLTVQRHEGRRVAQATTEWRRGLRAH